MPERTPLKNLVLPQPAPTPQSQASPPAIGLIFEGIPNDIYEMFGLKAFKSDADTISKLKDIYAWASKNSKSYGDSLLKISKLRNKLGVSGGEGVYNKMWRYIKVTNNMRGTTDKEMKQELGKIREAL